MVVLASCQDGYSITFENRCEADVQVRHVGNQREFETISPGQQSGTYGFAIEENHRFGLLVDGAAEEVIVQIDIDELEDSDGNSGTVAIAGSNCGERFDALQLTDNIELRSDLELEVLSAGSAGPGSERVRGRVLEGAYLITLGRVGAAHNVSLGSDFEYLVCGQVVEIHLVGTVWSLIVADPGPAGGWALVTVEQANFANADTQGDASAGLSLGLELLLGLRIGSEGWAPLDCDIDEAGADLRRHGLPL